MTCCGTVEMFLDLGLSPIADAYTATADELVERHPLRVGVCDKCRLVQLMDDVDPGFGSGYSFHSGASAPLRTYHRAYADSVLKRYPRQVADGVVEVGCNDGDLLRHFPGALGIDPSGPAREAKDRGLDVLVQPFTLDLARRLHHDRGRQGIVIANHVLAHVPDLGDTLAGMHLLLQNDGLAIVEVQYLPDLLVNNAFDLVYHEHRRFFSLTSLEHYAHQHGLYVVDAELTDRQGGSLRATLARGGAVNLPETDRVTRIRTAEHWLDDGYAGMQGRAERIRDRLVELVRAQEGITAIYGAPAKATTLLNFCGLTADDLSWCVDSTHAKQGRFIPGTGIQIVPTGFMGASVYLLAAHNYASHVIRSNPHKRFILPLPAPVVI
jgi:novobiocin biosynthesis protein NovU/D-mycarose 3-C-methyltransferase